MARKKANSRGVQPKEEEEDTHIEEVDEGQSSEVAFAGKKKSKKKKGSGFSKASFELLDGEGNDKDDEAESENDIPAASKKGGEEVEEAQSSEVAFAGKKKPKKKKGSGFSKVSFELLDDEGNDKDDEFESENDMPTVSKKSGNAGSSKSGFELLDDDEDKNDQSEDDEGGGVAATKTSFQFLEDEDEDARSEEDSVAPVSTRKNSTKGKKGASGFSLSSFDLLGDDEGDENEVGSGKDQNESENGDSDAPISFSGKKKKSKSGKKQSEGDPSMQEEDDTSITFSGKKKPSKKKNSTISAGSGDVDEAEPNNSIISSNGALVVPEVQKDNVPMATSKNKKKKKKSERTAQEEDELDKLLAELGGPSTSIPAPPIASSQEQKVVMQPEPNDETAVEKEAEEEGVVESAAAKKKKKKKEKEKEKKAAASAASAVEVKEEKPEEKKTKVDDKKVPKKVREMREAIARRQEAEERKKREEEEKLRKEEEERRKQEELEQQAEEARRRKKEREKEKLLKKKQEGKLLTAKQKEEQRRLEAIRNQFLSGKGVSLPADSGAPSKRPIYSTKKSKGQHAQTNGSAPSKTETVEEEVIKVQHTESAAADEVNQVVDEVKEEEKDETPAEVIEKVEEDEDDDEWDAKSWDDADIALKVNNSFEDEEVDSDSEPEPEPAMKKEVKKSVQLEPMVVSNSTSTSEIKQKPADVVALEKKREKSTSGLQSEQSEFSLRSPICCIMGHVDTGKTKLLDCIRGTNVQEGEAGGITQQIGATYFPAENIRERTKELKADAKLKVPGLLVIDTPGHESFTNLRSRGSGLCDIAILVVDIMHGLEPQTIESLNLLKMRNTEFIIALNKVDRLYGWKTIRNAPIVKAMKQQSKDVQNEFNHRLVGIITQFKEQGLNTELYYKNKEMGETFSIVPTSAISGEGIPDMLLLLVQWTQKTMIEKLTYSDDVQCTVLEVKVIEGHGTTIDVILVNGILHEGDQIVVNGMQGPIVTSIRALLTPHPMKELRIKGSYVHHKEIKAAQGIKITAQGLEHAIAGTSLHVVGPDDDLEDIKATANAEMQSVMTRIDKSGEGVCVQASTLGSLEALLEFLKTPAVNIPVSGIGIGPVHKKDVMRAGVMLEKKKEYATILAFDVKVTPEAREYADEQGVKIFIADIIYHLFDQFKAYLQNLKEEQKKEAADEAVFPCVLKILPNCVFNKKDPIVLGVDVLEGIAKVGTPICIPSRESICIGRIASIENNHKPVDIAKKGQKIAIKILGSNPEEQQKMFGRHFEEDDELVSQISRKSIDILKENYREELSMEDWKLVVKLKTLFKIQ